MKNSRLAGIIVSIILCMVFLAVPAGNAYATPAGGFDRNGRSTLAVKSSGFNNVPLMLNAPAPVFNGAATNAGGTVIAIFFDKAMADPTGKHGSFTYKINGGAAQPFSAAVLDANPANIVLICAGTAISAGNSITVNYTPGTVQSADGGLLAAFTNMPVENQMYPRMNLHASPYQIAANGTSTSTITAEVYASGGVHVADGTDVVFSTDKGSFGSSTVTSKTVSGIATATLTSAVSSNDMLIATVKVECVGIHKFTAVFFIPPGKPSISGATGDTIIGPGYIGLWYGWALFDAMGEHTLTAAMYDDNPQGTPIFNATGFYFDIHLDNVAGINNLTLLSCDPFIVPQDHIIIIYYWDGSQWKPASNQTYDNGCLTMVITDATYPCLSDLAGLPFAFGENPPPTITSVNPASGKQRQTLPVTITGTNLDLATAVRFGEGITVSNYTVNNNTQITANIVIAPNAKMGNRNVVVTTPAGNANKEAAFKVLGQDTVTSTPKGSGMMAVTPPAAPVSLSNIVVQGASLSASTVSPNTPVTVTADISNKSTVNGNKKVTVYVNGEIETTQGVTLNSGSSSQLTFNISRSEPGTYNVYVDGAPAGSFNVEAVTANDMILMISAAFLVIAFITGIVLLRRRQQHGS